jgi:hypothetical protein
MNTDEARYGPPAAQIAGLDDAGEPADDRLPGFGKATSTALCSNSASISAQAKAVR